MARRGTFSFDLSKPTKKGRLLKQGGFHKAFKSREFILYPGFLVYYDNENEWRLDITKGQLGSRQGAVKLKGSTVEIARNAPKGCKYGIMLTAPHPANKRQQYLMNASSKEVRDSWIEALRNSSPATPEMKAKAGAAGTPAAAAAATSQSKPKEETSEKPPERSTEERMKPSAVERQTTAVDAAVAAAMATDVSQEEKEIEEMASSVTGSLKNIEEVMKQRHNTATMAVLSLHIDESLEDGTDDDAFETNIDTVLDSRRDSSIDVVLGVQENTNGSSEEASSLSTDSNSRVASPLSDEAAATPSPVPMASEVGSNSTQLESREVIRMSESDSGEVTVTTVTVSCTSLDGLVKEENGDKDSAKENDGQSGGSESSSQSGEEEGGGKKMRTVTSTQILITDATPTISVNLSNYDSDDTLSDEESMQNLDTLSKDEETPPPPPVQNGDEANNAPAPATAGESTISTITVKEDRTGSSSSAGSDETSTLKAPDVTRRRSSSTPFIEKKGFLYKMGGQRKSWKLRYFVARPGAFQYFKDSRCQKMLGEVKLKNLQVFFPRAGERKQSYQFTVHTESSWNRRPDYVMAAQSEREMKEWITAFKLAGGVRPNATPPDSDEGAQ